MPARKFYLLRPDTLAAGLSSTSRCCLIIAALSLFFFTALLGGAALVRLSPVRKTVWTEAFIWMEQWTEGTALAADEARQGAVELEQAIDRKGSKHSCSGSLFHCGRGSPSSVISCRSRSSAPSSPDYCRSGGWAIVFWTLFYGFRDLRQRGLHARAGVQVHVSLRALPECDVRSRTH